jgi:two-component system response regulator RegX3
VSPFAGGPTMISTDGRSVVLVVEDEPSYQEALNIGLTVEGFVVVGASTLAQARLLMLSTRPDLVLLDVMLPDGSGIDYCRELHDTTHIPVIMVTARTSEVDVVLGLEIGAADYVTKPYRLRELVARIRAVLRRPVSATNGNAQESRGRAQSQRVRLARALRNAPRSSRDTRSLSRYLVVGIRTL